MFTRNNYTGDLNGQIIKRHLEDLLNNNKGRLIDLYDQNELQILNGFFQHKTIPLVHLDSKN